MQYYWLVTVDTVPILYFGSDQHDMGYSVPMDGVYAVRDESLVKRFFTKASQRLALRPTRTREELTIMNADSFVSLFDEAVTRVAVSLFDEAVTRVAKDQWSVRQWFRQGLRVTNSNPFVIFWAFFIAFVAYLVIRFAVYAFMHWLSDETQLQMVCSVQTFMGPLWPWLRLPINTLFFFINGMCWVAECMTVRLAEACLKSMGEDVKPIYLQRLNYI